MRPHDDSDAMARIHDEFDVYFARAKLDEQMALEKQQMEGGGGRRGSLPDATLTLEVSTHHRRALSCKLPLRKRSKKNSSKKGSPSKEASPSPPPTQNAATLSDILAHSASAACLDTPDPQQGVSMTYVTEPTLRAPSPRLGTKCHSAPHSRSSSCKERGGASARRRGGASRGSQRESPEHNAASADASRQSSITRFEEEVAAKLQELKVLQSENALVVRNFSLSANRGLINRGDSFKRRPRPATSEQLSSPPGGAEAGEADASTHLLPRHEDAEDSPTLHVPPPVHKVLVIGDRGVGKTALLQQFMTSQYMGAAETSFDDDCEKMVTVMVDRTETTIYFMDVPVEADLAQYGAVDGYLLVFSITTRPSFHYVKDILETLCAPTAPPEQRHVAKILVANKGDLVRKRTVSESDARSLCVRHDCKYSEVSAVLNHKLDELLVGLVTQMRLTPERMVRARDAPSRAAAAASCVSSAKNLIRHLFKKGTSSSSAANKSCDNLLTL